MIQEQKYTPGPWVIERIPRRNTEPQEYSYQIRSDPPDAEKQAAICETDTPQLNFDEEAANARLIAAAPDLLAAAENILLNLDDDKTLKRRSRDQLIFKSSVIRQLLRSAIANVKGA